MQHCMREHNRQVWLYAGVVMPDHVHLLLDPLRKEDGHLFSLAQMMQSIKSASAHSLNKLLKRSGPVWDEEYWDHYMRSDDELRATVQYIQMNPLKRGLVKRSSDYRWLWTNIEEFV